MMKGNFGLKVIKFIRLKMLSSKIVYSFCVYTMGSFNLFNPVDWSCAACALYAIFSCLVREHNLNIYRRSSLPMPNAVCFVHYAKRRRLFPLYINLELNYIYLYGIYFVWLWLWLYSVLRIGVSAVT